MEYTIVLLSNECNYVRTTLLNVPLDTPLKQFLNPDFLNGSTVNFNFDLLFNDNLNTQEEPIYFSSITISVEFVTAFTDEPITRDVSSYFWATETATIQDLLDCIKSTYTPVVFYKQNNKRESESLFSAEVRLKRWVFEALAGCNFLYEEIPYGAFGNNGFVVSDLIVSEKQGDVFVPVENWLTYKPENPSNFYVRFEFTLRTHSGELLTVAQHIVSTQQIKQMLNEHANTPVFSLPIPAICFAEEYNAEQIFNRIQHLYYYFEGGSLAEICLKVSPFLEIVQSFNVLDLLSSPLSEKVPYPVHLADVRLATAEEEARARTLDRPRLPFVDDLDSIELPYRVLEELHYQVLRERIEPNIFKDYIVSLFFKQKK